jgi:pimeloyl-ACP methyl ester carboxylesterase
MLGPCAAAAAASNKIWKRRRGLLPILAVWPQWRWRPFIRGLMTQLRIGGVLLAYDDVGPPEATSAVVLLHGFASNRTENWRRVGWLGAFERRRTRAVALDMRGHGESDKPHDPAAYASSALIGDVLGIIDALQIRSVTLMGYSMGARLALSAAIRHPDRFSRLILGGIGEKIFEPAQAGSAMGDAMHAQDPETITEPLLRSFRHFADEQGEDRQALAACALASRDPFAPADVKTVRAQTLVVAGSRDELAGSTEELAALIPGARAVTLPGCDHFSTIAHALFKAAVFDFLEETEI